jgi:hypothetical protein
MTLQRASTPGNMQCADDKAMVPVWLPRAQNQRLWAECGARGERPRGRSRSSLALPGGVPLERDYCDANFRATSADTRRPCSPVALAGAVN